MNIVQSAALTICLALLLTVLIRHLAPRGLSQTLMWLVCGIFILATVFQAVRGVPQWLSSFDFSWQVEESELAQTVYRQRMGEAEGALYDYLAGLLDAAEIPWLDLYIFMDTQQTESIELDRIHVTVPSASARDRTVSLLEELFTGVTIEVKIDE